MIIFQTTEQKRALEALLNGRGSHCAYDDVKHVFQQIGVRQQRADEKLERELEKQSAPSLMHQLGDNLSHAIYNYCPHCNIKMQKSDHPMFGSGGPDRKHMDYKCPDCGHTDTFHSF